MSPRLLLLVSVAGCSLPSAPPSSAPWQTPALAPGQPPAPSPSPAAAPSAGADLIEYTAPAGFASQTVGQQVVLTRTDDATATYQAIVVFSSRATQGAPERDFAAEWQANVASNFTAQDAPSPVVARSPGSVPYLEGGDPVRTSEGATAYAHLWMFVAGGRLQSVMIMTPSRKTYDDAQPVLQGFLGGIRLRGAAAPAVAPTANAVEPASDAPIVGIWLGFMDEATLEYNEIDHDLDLKLSQTKIRWRTFLADGSSFEGLPNEGLLGLDVAMARADANTGAFWGTWTIDGDQVTATQPAGRRQIYELSGDELRQDPKTTGHGVFWRVKSVDGLRLDGTWATSMKWDESFAGPTWKSRPLISFRSDGTFVDEGAFMYSPLDSPDANPTRRPGRGTYEIKAFTLVLHYDDGHEVRRACMGPAKRDAMRDASVLYFGQFLFYRQ